MVESVAGAQGTTAAEGGDGLHELREQIGFRAGELPAADAHVLLALPSQRLAAQVALVAGCTHREPRQRVREDGNVPALAIEAELVTVEGQPRFQAQRVARAETHRGGLELYQPVPEGQREVAGREELEADGFSRVSGSRQSHFTTLEAYAREPVALVLGQGIRAEHVLGDDLGARTLECQHAQFFAPVGQRALCTDPLREPGPVPGAIVRVDHEQEAVRVEAVQVGVVDGAAFVVGKEGVLGVTGFQCPRVVGQGALKEVLGPLSGNLEAAHVGYVEESRSAPGGEMLADDAGAVLDGHLEPRKGHHSRALLYMPGVELGEPEHAVVQPIIDPLRAMRSPPGGRGGKSLFRLLAHRLDALFVTERRESSTCPCLRRFSRRCRTFRSWARRRRPKYGSRSSGPRAGSTGRR